MKMGKLNKQNLKVLNATTALQIIIVNWALRATTTNSRVSFIDLYMYLVFPTNFRIVFLPHTNSVILLEPYCGTISQSLGYLWVYEGTQFFSKTIVNFPVISSVISPHSLNNFTTGAPKTEQNKHFHNMHTEKRQNRSDKENQ